jgi:hypothetical protein
MMPHALHWPYPTMTRGKNNEKPLSWPSQVYCRIATSFNVAPLINNLAQAQDCAQATSEDRRVLAQREM